MKYGLLSGMLWGLDTFILGLAFLYPPFLDASDAALACAFVHDVVCVILLVSILIHKKTLDAAIRAFKTRGGIVIALGALLGGPLGMSGYLAAINNIGSSHTAIISAFYPAVGTFLAVMLLKETITFKRIIALVIALIGVVAIGLHSAQGSIEGNTVIGIAGALLCVFGWGSEAVFLAWGMKESDEVDTYTALFIREVTSALVYGIVIVPLCGSYQFVGTMCVSPATVYVVGAGIAGVCSYLWYYKAIATIGAARAMAFNISYCAWALIYSAVYAMLMPDVIELMCCVAIFVGTTLSATSDWSELKFWASSKYEE